MFEDNWAALQLMLYMSTQWLVGPGGATGLNYVVAHHKLDREKLDPEEYERRMEDLMVMERAALAAMRKQQEK